MVKFIKKLNASLVENKDILDRPCRCLGSRIKDQMYAGVDNANSTLVTGQYDDDDSWDVDPACDMSTDRMTMEIREVVPTVDPIPPAE